MSFASIIVRFPYVILIVFTVITSICLIVPLSLQKVPKFSDPQLGFETRGTELAKRLVTWQHLLESTKHSGPFVSNPKTFLFHQNRAELNMTKKLVKKKKTSKKFIGNKHEKKTNKTGRANKTLINESTNNARRKHYFCGIPGNFLKNAHSLLYIEFN